MAGLEILAPAGSIQSLEAALLCGADAVYFGIDCLNARRNAENFTVEGLRELVGRCHMRGVKAYLTLNIVVLENEITQLIEAAKAACDAGVDAVIVQDLGAASILRRCCPQLRLNASTQMAVHNAQGAKQLEKMGFSRVVLARECSREEIAEIVRAVDIEVEVFVHGALCMCVSGQCYMSSVLGQRSGNRGLCAQPCRLTFETPATEYALSLKDNSLISRIQEIEELGVTSAKIEGRMKRPEYVAAAVTACRAARVGEPVDLDSLQAVFSRSGFTSGYFDGARDLQMFGIREKADVTAAAGVLSKLENLYTDPRKQVHKVGVSLSFEMKEGQSATLTVCDSDGNQVRIAGAVPELANNKPTDPERAKAALEKMGGTPYYPTETNCVIAPGLILPASAINAMRREALEQLDEIRKEIHPIAFNPEKLGTIAKHVAPPKPQMRLELSLAGQYSDTLAEDAELITMPLKELEKLLKLRSGLPVEKFCVDIPRMLFGGQAALLSGLKDVREQGVKHAAVGNLSGFELAEGLDFMLHGSGFLNAVNSYSIQMLLDLGLSDLQLSPELSLDAAKRLHSPIPVGMLAYGYLALMTMRNCPVKAAVGCARCAKGENFVTDRKGIRLHTSCVWGCSELLNSVPLYMGDRVPELNGLDFYTLRFTLEDAGEAARMVQMYQNGAEYDGKFTRGLLYKTIL